MAGSKPSPYWGTNDDDDDDEGPIDDDNDADARRGAFLSGPLPALFWDPTVGSNGSDRAGRAPIEHQKAANRANRRHAKTSAN